MRGQAQTADVLVPVQSLPSLNGRNFFQKFPGDFQLEGTPISVATINSGIIMTPDRLKTYAAALFLTALIAVSPVRAADPHFYISAEVGRSSVNDNDLSIDEEATGFGLAVGYQILPWLALDAGYTDFGTFDANLDDPIWSEPCIP